MSAVSVPPASASTLRRLTAARVRELLAGDALAIDLRPIGDYLVGHIHGSIPLLFEPGPGLGGRARDLLPLDARLVLLDDDHQLIAECLKGDSTAFGQLMRRYQDRLYNTIYRLVDHAEAVQQKNQDDQRSAHGQPIVRQWLGRHICASIAGPYFVMMFPPWGVHR